MNDILTNRFGLLSKTGIKKGYVLYSYYFKDRYTDTRKQVVAHEITALQNGGCGGYIYVAHLKEFNNHPARKKDGYLKIGDLTMDEFIDIAEKVIREYK
ncbi:hypothetical protein [Desulfotruncus arcticus]|uniref:hypothetical protein n=1 Tax=Desulfotruncus arcticus TaxID=341036 RepID=UPI001041D058|nr:hypothetical protein [Desulfotruncus arcticus]